MHIYSLFELVTEKSNFAFLVITHYCKLINIGAIVNILRVEFYENAHTNYLVANELETP